MLRFVVTVVVSTLLSLLLLSVAVVPTQAFLVVSSSPPPTLSSRTTTTTTRRRGRFVTTPVTIMSMSSSPSSQEEKKKKKVLIPIADGSEEIETTCIQDTLVRFGANVVVASVMPEDRLLCTMSRGIKMQADVSITQVANDSDWDLIVLPGGMPGAEHLRDCQPLVALLKQQMAAGKLYGAICAAPAVVLAAHDLIPDGAAVTCYPAPAFRAKLANVAMDDDPSSVVVVTNNLITSQGPGTALLFGLQLGEMLYGKEKRDEIAKQMLV